MSDRVKHSHTQIHAQIRKSTQLEKYTEMQARTHTHRDAYIRTHFLTRAPDISGGNVVVHDDAEQQDGAARPLSLRHQEHRRYHR